jgi:hypothetical protein
MPISSTSNTFRLFISSTFSDFVAEREALQKRVFPELEKFCAERGARFQAIDLRWGITEEAQQEHDTLRICLEEVRRCQALSPRPNFAVLLGDRYGWEPVPARVPMDHWERLLAATAGPDGDIIRNGYEGPDLNAIPPVMHLKKRQGDGASNEQGEALLRAALRRAADTVGFTGDERLPYFASATHQEIALGALDTEDEEGNPLHPEEHVNVYVRRIAGLPNDASARAFIDWDAETQFPVEGARPRLAELERQLRERLPGKVHDIRARWGIDGTEESHLDAFCAQFLADQQAIIERELSSRHKLPDNETRNAQHHSFAKERARNFVGRETVLERILSYLDQSAAIPPLIVHASGGTGKSALMARAYLKSIEGASDDTVRLARFIGGVPGTESLMTLLIELTGDIAAAYGRPGPPAPESMKAARQGFEEALRGSTVERPLVLFLDALDQLDSNDDAWRLEWLPQELGEHTRVVASTREGQTLLSAQRRYPKTLLEVPAMTLAEGIQMLDAWLADTREAHYNAGIAPARGRRLTQPQREQVLGTFANNGKPLWLKLACEEARSWTSWDDAEALPATVESMAQDRITRRLLEGENHPPSFATRALAYLTAGRFGLSEEELNHALATDPEVTTEFEAQNAKTGQKWQLDEKRPQLPPILWSRLYFDLQPYLTTAHIDGTIVYRWFHREFDNSLYEQLLGSKLWRTFIHGRLADTHRALDSASRADESGDDRLYAYTDPDGTPSLTALRRIMEQPWQLARAIGEPGTEPRPRPAGRPLKLAELVKRRRYELKALLSDFGFCQAKAHRIDDLIRDWSEIPIDGPESRQWQQFLLTRAPILRQRATKAAWPTNRIFLQLALEEDPESAVAVSASSWLARCQPEWTVSKAPRAQPKRLSVQLLPPGTDSAGDVYLDRQGRIVLEQADRSGRAYDADNGRYLGVVDAVERPVGSPSDAPPSTTGPGSVWPLGEGRWFRWQLGAECGGPDGTAALYDPQIGNWTPLPQVHHHQVWTAASLSDGRYASLGLNSNRGVLVIGSRDRPAELLRVDTGPNDPDKPAGILELGDRSLVIWPAFSDGCGLWLKPLGDRSAEIDNTEPTRTRLWCAVPLGDTTSGLLKAIRIDDARFLTLSGSGEVRIWFTEFLERAARSKDRKIMLRSSTYPNQPHSSPRLSRATPGAHWDALASDRSLRRIYKTAEGRLFASDSRQDDRELLEWKSAPICSFQTAGKNHSNLKQAALKSAEMDLDAKLTVPRHWDEWVARVQEHGALHLHPRLWLVGTASRLAPPDAQDPNPQVWGRWLYHYLREDRQRKTPHFTDPERRQLVEQALSVLLQLAPEDSNAAIWQTEVCRRDAKRWRDGTAKSPLALLMEHKPHDDDLKLAWIAFCESENRDWALAQCAELARLRPNYWPLLLRWAQIIEHIDTKAARALRLKSVNLLGISASVRLIPGTEGYDLWEIYLNGRWSVWACDRPSPNVFAVDGQRLVLAGAPLDGIRYLTLGHE